MDDPASDAARLRKLGLRATGPRLALLTVLERVGGHRSADELVAELRQAGYPHARTTVYNALDLDWFSRYLEDDGSVHVRDPSPC